MPTLRYCRRKPEQTVLHQVVRDHLHTFLQALDQSDTERGVPLFVKREFRRFVRCGVLAHGFARFRCKGCGTERLVGFSCKGRGFCPSCGGRRMTERALHLTEHVLPQLPTRQWVLSLPFALRYRLAWDHELCRKVLGVYVRALQGLYMQRAKRMGHPQGRTGCVTVIQRFGGALNLNIHFHTLVIDGVFCELPDGSLSFVQASAPTDTEVEQLVVTIQRRVVRLLTRRGLLTDDVDDDIETPDESPLHSLYAASVQSKIATGARAGAHVLRLQRPSQAQSHQTKRKCHAHLDGFDLHADTAVHSGDRARLGRLCRYMLRPPIATDRLSRKPDGRLLLRLKKPWRDGTQHILFEPIELLEKLAALVPRPYTNLILYHGVLSPNAKWRRQVVGFGKMACAVQGPGRSPNSKPPINRSWAELMRKGLELDVTECPQCGGQFRFVAAILKQSAIQQILTHLGLPSERVKLQPARAPPDLEHSWAC